MMAARSVVLLALCLAACASCVFAARSTATRGDIVYLESPAYTSGTTTLKVVDSGGNTILSQDTGSHHTQQVAVSSDGKLAFVTIAQQAGVKTNVMVHRIAGGTPGLEKRINIPVLGMGALALCSLSGAVAVSAATGANLNYNFWVAVSCRTRCPSRSGVASTNYVLKLVYNAKTKGVSSSGRILVGDTRTCSAAVVNRVPELAWINNSLYAVIADVKGETWQYRQLLDDPHVVTTFDGKVTGGIGRANCLAFAAGSSSTFFGNCPPLIGLAESDFDSGNVKKISSGAAHVTKFNKPNPAFGRGYFTELATLDDAAIPLYALAVEQGDTFNIILLALDKNNPHKTGARVANFGINSTISGLSVVN